jgi:hypothetical protein
MSVLGKKLPKPYFRAGDIVTHSRSKHCVARVINYPKMVNQYLDGHYMIVEYVLPNWVKGTRSTEHQDSWEIVP